MANLKMSPLPKRATDDVLQAHKRAKESIATVAQHEQRLRDLRREAKQKIIQYENLVLELQGQLAIPWEGGDGGSRVDSDDGNQRGDRD